MSAFFNEPKLKQAVMSRLREDRRLDRLAQGVYFKDGKGCHLGCLTRCNKNSHQATERMFNIPIRIAYWLEVVFEGLPKDKCEWWVIEGTNAIPVGADLSKAHHELFYWLLGLDSPSSEGNKNKLVSEQISIIRQLHRQAADGLVVTRDQWGEAAIRSSKLASSAVKWTEPKWAAKSAYESTRVSSSSVKWAVNCSVKRAGYEAWISIAEKSIEIFKSCPIVECDKCEESVQTAMDSITNHIFSPVS